MLNIGNVFCSRHVFWQRMSGVVNQSTVNTGKDDSETNVCDETYSEYS